MREPGGERDLPLETLDSDSGRCGFGEDLDGDGAIRVCVVRAIHDGHATAADFLLQPESFRQTRDGVHRHEYIA